MLIKRDIRDEKFSKGYPTLRQSSRSCISHQIVLFLHTSIEDNLFYTLFEAEECCIAEGQTRDTFSKRFKSLPDDSTADHRSSHTHRSYFIMACWAMIYLIIRCTPLHPSTDSRSHGTTWSLPRGHLQVCNLNVPLCLTTVPRTGF